MSPALAASFCTTEPPGKPPAPRSGLTIWRGLTLLGPVPKKDNKHYILKSDPKEIQKFHSTGAIPSGVAAACCCLLFREQRRQERTLEMEQLPLCRSLNTINSFLLSLCVILCHRNKPMWWARQHSFQGSVGMQIWVGVSVTQRAVVLLGLPLG